MNRTTRTASGLAALSLGVASVVLAPAAAQAKPDTDCMRAGISTLKSAGLFSTVARDGLPIATAVAVGVTPRAGTDVASHPHPQPRSVVRAAHRAGDDSLVLYPWC
jgi:hypothetical protein